MKTYTVKDIFWTIQGEGINAGRAAMFVRFAGCNLWSGSPDKRGAGVGACAQWCDTGFVGGVKHTEKELAETMAWKLHEAGVDVDVGKPLKESVLCVISGGEPCLQLSTALVKHLQVMGWEVAVETNGTVANDALDLCDHVCVSPKLAHNRFGQLPEGGGHVELKVWSADELKVVLPGGSHGWSSSALKRLALKGRWDNMYVQPMDPAVSDGIEDTFLHPQDAEGEDAVEVMAKWSELQELWQQNVLLCTEWVRANPQWRISVQSHKFLGVA